jgi:hypothetical protein
MNSAAFGDALEVSGKIPVGIPLITLRMPFLCG